MALRVELRIDRAKPEIPEWSGRVPAYQGMMSLMTFFPIRHSFNLKRFNLKLAGALAAAAMIAGGLAAPAFADDDPPALVGRLAVIDGTVSFHTKDETTWAAATPNYPMTSGNAIWADANSHAGIQLGANDVNLGSQTELDIDHLDDQTFQASLPQGTAYLNLRALSNGDQIQIATPRGTVNINQPGRYEIFSGDQTHPSTVTVLEGAAQVTGDNNLNLPVSAGQTGVLRDDGQGGQVSATLAQAPAGEDELMAWARSREAPQAAPAPQETAQMTGAQDLARYGSWSTSPDYGNVWYPQVAADWVPYRSGHWAWVAPWGWTWVDDAPWGFAPFHYGRWVQIGHRWCWAPRPVVVVGAPVVPIYAPALVTFVGDIGGVGVSIGIGGPSVGWVPLGPREVYYPPYRVSERYVRNVNVTYVKNVNIINVHNTTVINNNVTVNRFVNHGAVTVVSRDTMTRSQRVSGNVQHVDQHQLDQMHGFNGRQAPLAPTAQTVGLTPTEAKHYGFSSDQLQRKSAAGPNIQQNRNWSQRTPSANQAGKPNQLQTNNRQQNQLQNTSHQQNNQPGAVGEQQQNRQNKWTDRGSRKPGSNVVQPGAQQPQQLQGNNGQLNNGHGNNNPSNNGQLNNNQVQLHNQNNDGTAQQNTHNQGQPNQGQQKWNWANNNKSRQPGAAVQQQPGQSQSGQSQQQLQQENGQAAQDKSKRNQNNQSTETRIIRPQGESKSQGQSNQQATDWQARQQKQKYEQNQQYQQNQHYQQQQQERAVQQQQYQAERQQQQNQRYQQQQQERAVQQQQQQLIQQQNQHRQSQGEQVQHTNQSSHQQQPQIQQVPQQ